MEQVWVTAVEPTLDHSSLRILSSSAHWTDLEKHYFRFSRWLHFCCFLLFSRINEQTHKNVSIEFHEVLSFSIHRLVQNAMSPSMEIRVRKIMRRALSKIAAKTLRVGSYIKSIHENSCSWLWWITMRFSFIANYLVGWHHSNRRVFLSKRYAGVCHKNAFFSFRK